MTRRAIGGTVAAGFFAPEQGTGMIRRSVALAALPAALVAAAPARADVMEVGPAGYTWLNGPAAHRPDTAPPNAPTPPPQPARGFGPQQWSAHLDTLAARYDLSPALIEAVVWQESRWHPDAVSPAGALGLAQLMPGTARQLGVDPRDPAANLEGGARYLRMQLDAFGGDIEKALAAYNAGPARVQRAGQVPRIRETRNYVVSVLGRLSDQTRR